MLDRKSGRDVVSANTALVSKCFFSSTRYFVQLECDSHVLHKSALQCSWREGGPTTSRPDFRSPIDLDLAWKTFRSSDLDPFRKENIRPFNSVGGGRSNNILPWFLIAWFSLENIRVFRSRSISLGETLGPALDFYQYQTVQIKYCHGLLALLDKMRI